MDFYKGQRVVIEEIGPRDAYWRMTEWVGAAAVFDGWQKGGTAGVDENGYACYFYMKLVGEPTNRAFAQVKLRPVANYDEAWAEQDQLED